MRRYILSLIAGTALACGATTANAAITIGTTGSSAGSTLTMGAVDNTGMPETFSFNTHSNTGAGSPYTSFFNFMNDLTGFYNFSITAATLDGTITLEEVLSAGPVVVTSITGSGPTLALLTPTLTAGTQYRFVFTSSLPSGGNASGNAAFYAVPEPGTWAMMLLGFGGIGFAMRRRQKPSLAQLA